MCILLGRVGNASSVAPIPAIATLGSYLGLRPWQAHPCHRIIHMPRRRHRRRLPLAPMQLPVPKIVAGIFGKRSADPSQNRAALPSLLREAERCEATICFPRQLLAPSLAVRDHRDLHAFRTPGVS